MKSQAKLTRRSLVGALGTAGVAAPLVRKASAQTRTGTNAVALAVTGDESHNSDVYRTALRWVQEGGSLWAWHYNSRLSLMRQDYRDVQGATIIGHPPVRPFKVKIINHDHPITKGVNDFVVTDEQHFPVYEKDPEVRASDESAGRRPDVPGGKGSEAQ